LTAVITPKRITQIKVARIGCRTDRSPCDAADNSARDRASRHRADRSPGAGAKQTPGNGAIAWRRTAG
jgi:hypothetical protein